MKAKGIIILRKNRNHTYGLLLYFFFIVQHSGVEGSLIRQGPGHQRVRAGTTIHLRCDIDTEHVSRRLGTGGYDFGLHRTPDVDIEWKKDDEFLFSPGSWKSFELGLDYESGSRDHRVSRVQGGRLVTLNNVTTADTGLYTCMARHYEDVDSASAQLVVEDVPETPSDVVMTSCSSRVVQLQWRMINENHSPITQYLIEYNTSFEPEVWKVAKTSIPRDRTYERIALSPWGNYTFRILAENSVGRSRPSQPTQEMCSTPPEVPHINPRGVCAVNERPHALVIKWELMAREEQNAPGFYYLVRWRRQNAPLKDSDKFEERMVDSDSNQLTVESQPIYQAYEIYVIAMNEMGEAASAPRALIGYSGEDVPLEVPEGFQMNPGKPVTESTVDLQWNAVNTGPWRIQGFFRGYKIQLWKTEEGLSTLREHTILYREAPGCWGHTDRVGQALQKRSLRELSRVVGTVEINTAHIYNLWPFTNITAHIMVLNSKYEGRPSQPITFTTKEGVPEAVDKLAVAGRSSTSLRLEWRRPRSINGILTGYTLTYRVLEPKHSQYFDHFERIELDGSDRTTLKLQGLVPSHTYHLVLAARTRAGPGPAVHTQGRTLPDGPPPKPMITTSSLGSRSVNVTWRISDHIDLHSHLVYTALYRRLGEWVWTITPEVRQENWTVLEGLDSGLVYEIRVVSRYGEETGGQESSSTTQRVRLGMKRDLRQPMFEIVHAGFSKIKIGLSDFDTSNTKTFHVDYRVLGTERWLKTAEMSGYGWVVLEDLTSGNRYELNIVWTDDMGDKNTQSRIINLGSDPDAQASVGINAASRSAFRLSTKLSVLETCISVLQTVSLCSTVLYTSSLWTGRRFLNVF